MEGKSINGFTLKRLLGVGGMAEVWYAESEIGMKAAVKILSEELSHSTLMRERFLNEAKVMVQLDHPSIRKVYGYGEMDGRPAIVMEYLDGDDLRTRMKRGQHFTDEELQHWWNQMVDALNYTHAQNIVHRDIKPSNIFIDQKGNAKLLDFGIAKVADNTTGTLTGSTLGTRIYMSPEQVKDPKRVGTASDTYSLAITFVHLLTGKAPYDSTTDNDYDIQESIVRKPLDLSAVPSGWRGFLAPFFIKNPDERPNLRPCVEVKEPSSGSEETVAWEVGVKPNPMIPNHKRSILLWLSGIAAVLVLIPLLVYVRRNPDVKAFSVSRNTIVRFAPGNLQYQPSTDTWRFAEHQWDYVGEANSLISSNYSGWLDLFGWDTGNNPTRCSPSSISSFHDWGDNTISNAESECWRTLSGEEWWYVFFSRRTKSGIRFAKAIVNDVNGIILFPNDWRESYYKINNANDSRATFNGNSISPAEWTYRLEENGAVFLPAAGWGSWALGKVYEMGSSGEYWSSDHGNNRSSFSMSFDDELIAGGGNSAEQNGRYSVRLVCPFQNH